MGFPKRYDGDLRETLFRSQGSQVSMHMAMGSGSLLSTHGRGIGPQDAPKDSQGLSRVAAGNPGFPGLGQGEGTPARGQSGRHPWQPPASKARWRELEIPVDLLGRRGPSEDAGGRLMAKAASRTGHL